MEYNNIDSIGSEISYSESDHNLKSQEGRGVFAYLFGENGSKTQSDPKSNANMTELIVKAIDSGKEDVADFLLEQRFVPDMEYVNQKGENLLHALINAGDKMKHANQALAQLIADSRNKIYLNKQDNNGITPFYKAVQKGYMNVAKFMEDHGAKRITPNINQFIETDREGIYDSARDTYDSAKNTAKTIFEKQVQTRPSVPFSVQSATNKGKSSIQDIVKQFKLSSEPETELPQTVASQTENPEELAPKPTFSYRDVEKHVQKLSELAKAKSKTGIPQITTKSNPQILPVDPTLSSETFINELASKLIDQSKDQSVQSAQSNLAQNPQPNLTQSIFGGAKSKPVKKITGKRNMVNFSEVSDAYLLGGMSDNEMRNIARAATSQKNKFHEEAIEKILANLPDPKDPSNAITARAVKAIIYDEIKQQHKDMSGLDRAAELLRSITKKNVSDVLKKKDLVKKIVDYLEDKNKQRESKNSKSKSQSRPKPEFESSIDETSSYDSDL